MESGIKDDKPLKYCMSCHFQ